MDNVIRKRIEQDLETTISRLHEPAAAVAALLGAVGTNSPFADAIDEVQASESRELGFATRERLLERVNRLREALDRVIRGEYGACAECGEPISPARLRAIPEAQTCLHCQDGLEHGRSERGWMEPALR